MRLCVTAPGPDHSTYDVYRGLVVALQAQGHEVIKYPLDRGLQLAVRYCRVLKRAKFITTVDMSSVQHIAGVFALDRALHYDVEWVLIVAAQLFHPDLIVKLRRAGRKVAIVFTESPYESEQEVTRVPYANVVFTNERTTAAEWSKIHPHVHYLPHAYDPAIHHPEPAPDEPDVLAHDVVFVGTAWPERIKFLEQVNWEGIDLGLYGINWDKRMRKNSPLRQFLSERVVPNAETTALYRRAKIGLNLHRAHPTAESLNPRARELAAAGCFFLSDERAEMHELFGSAAPRFSTPDELEQAIRYWLAHDRLRAEMEAMLPGLVRGHEFAARARVVAAALENAC